MHRGKYYCTTCGWAAKGPCPAHPSLAMPQQWRPGRKGSRMRIWDSRVLWRRQEAGRLNSIPYFSYYGQAEADIRRYIRDHAQQMPS